MLQLRGKVIGLNSGSKYVDKKARVEIRIAGADSYARDISIPNDADLKIDQELIITVMEMGAPELEAERLEHVKTLDRPAPEVGANLG